MDECETLNGAMDLGTTTRNPSEYRCANYLGVCPQCAEVGDYEATYLHLSGEWLDVLCCEEHSCYWIFDWHYADPNRPPEDVPGNMAAKLAAMTEVEPRLSPKTERRRARECRQRLIAKLDSYLSDEQQEVVIAQLCRMTGMAVDDDR